MATRRTMEAHSERPATGGQRDLRSAMSDHVAYALLVYTGLQIFVTVQALKEGFSSILPYMSLFALVALIIPFCRFFERRWTRLDDEAAADPALLPKFRRDVILLWLLAIGFPLLLTGIIKALLPA